jgi:putative tricarboxylic transport membrane protein
VTGGENGPSPAWGRPDAVCGLALLLVAVFAWAAAWPLPLGTLHQPGAGFLPKSLAVMVALLSAALLVRGVIVPAASVRGLWPDRRGLLRVALMLAALLGYVGILERVGYVLTTAALFVLLLRWVGRQSWPITAAVAILAAGGSYLLFARWLLVSLPVGLWAP